jgi:hypothetical protein
MKTSVPGFSDTLSGGAEGTELETMGTVRADGIETVGFGCSTAITGFDAGFSSTGAFICTGCSTGMLATSSDTSIPGTTGLGGFFNVECIFMIANETLAEKATNAPTRITARIASEKPIFLRFLGVFAGFGRFCLAFSEDFFGITGLGAVFSGFFIRIEGFDTPPFRAIKKVLNPEYNSLLRTTYPVPLGRGC